MALFQPGVGVAALEELRRLGDAVLIPEALNIGHDAVVENRVRVLAPAHPEWKNEEPFKAVLSGDLAAVAHFTEKDWTEIVGATHAGMSTDEFLDIAKRWLETAKHPRFERL